MQSYVDSVEKKWKSGNQHLWQRSAKEGKERRGERRARDPALYAEGHVCVC